MTLAERLTTAAAQAVADAKYQGVGRTIAWKGPTHIDARYGRAVVVAVLRELAESHTVDAGTWWEQNDPVPVYKLIELADEIERGAT